MRGCEVTVVIAVVVSALISGGIQKCQKKKKGISLLYDIRGGKGLMVVVVLLFQNFFFSNDEGGRGGAVLNRNEEAGRELGTGRGEGEGEGGGRDQQRENQRNPPVVPKV
jgi:hypothetical protein